MTIICRNRVVFYTVPCFGSNGNREEKCRLGGIRLRPSRQIDYKKNRRYSLTPGRVAVYI